MGGVGNPWLPHLFSCSNFHALPTPLPNPSSMPTSSRKHSSATPCWLFSLNTRLLPSHTPCSGGFRRQRGLCKLNLWPRGAGTKAGTSLLCSGAQNVIRSTTPSIPVGELSTALLECSLWGTTQTPLSNGTLPPPAAACAGTDTPSSQPPQKLPWAITVAGLAKVVAILSNDQRTYGYKDLLL